jgi:hypothetical protein
MVAMKVSEGQITSSPGPTPRSRSPRCMPAVPLARATEGRPTRSEKLASKASRLGPTVESQLE